MSLKIILLWDKNVGKSCLIKQYLYKSFSSEYFPTNSNCNFNKDIQVNNLIIKTTIWDTNGQKQYKLLDQLFLNNTDIVLLVYDITNMKSYINLKKWYKNLKNNCDNIKILGIIANKIDLDFDQIISKEEGENYAKRINALFFETSSMQYEYVDSVFEKLVEKYINDGYNYEIFLKNENNLMNQSIMSSKSENIRIENDRDNSKSSSCLK